MTAARCAKGGRRHRDLRSGAGPRQATYTNPHQLAEGMDYVFVNGVPVIADGKFTADRPGKVLRKR
jgi:N-acyl-D-aspartate/D-glutamate deacylase